MEHKEEQSSDNIDQDLPFVTALTTPFPQSNAGPHAETLSKIKERERDIQKYKRQIQELDFAIAMQEAYNTNIEQSHLIPRTASAPPPTAEHLDEELLLAQEQEIQEQEAQIKSLMQSLATKRQDYANKQQVTSPALRRTVETPGPHRLQPRPERPVDITYKQQQEQQKQAESEQAQPQASSSHDEIANIFKSLTKVLSDNNKQLHSNDVSDPPKFHGHDSQWDDWYLSWRTYLEAKGWLTTVEHPTGPGTVGFDNETNKKVYNKLLSLCQKGAASTYITKAAHFNGWEASKYLLERYEGFSKQRQHSLRKLIENIRHVHGTNMSRHVDKFERICGQMAHNNPTTPPTDENKIDWFLDSVTEKAYDSVHATCSDKLLEGELTFAKAVKLYTHRCFQVYPHFQVEDIDKDNKPLTNNSTTFRRTKGDKGKGKSNKGTGRGRDQHQRHNTRSNSTTPGKGKGKGPRSSSKGKGKGKSNTRNTGNRQPSKDPCSYCGGWC